MVAGYVVVKLFPKPFDRVVFGRVRRQEMQANPAVHGLKRVTRLTRLVNVVIVQDEMNRACAAIGRSKHVEQIDEERGVFRGPWL